MSNSADAALKAAMKREKMMKSGASMEQAYGKHSAAGAAMKHKKKEVKKKNNNG